MNNNSLSIGKFLGIPVRLHVSWFLVFVLVTTGLAAAYFPQQHPSLSVPLYWVLGIITSLLFFASVLLHEMAHSVVAQQRGLNVRGIVLFVFGGVSEIAEEPQTPKTELLMAIVGPLTSIALSILFALLWLPARGFNEPLAAVLGYMSTINLVLGLFNLVPGFPLDGGRVLRALLWWRSESLEWSTRWASRAGQVVAYAFMAIGIWQVLTGSLVNGLWIAFIGWFLDNAAQGSYRQVVMRTLISGHTVGEIMTRGCTAVSPDSTLQEVVEQHILAQGRRCLPVMHGETLLGMLTIHRIKAFARQEWPLHTAREVMIPREELRSTHPGEGLAKVLTQMSDDGVNQLPVLEHGRLVGLLTRENITTFLRLKSELGV